MKTTNGLERKKTVYTGHDLPASLPEGFDLHDVYVSSVRKSKDGTWYLSYRIEFLGQDDELIIYEGTMQNSDIEALTNAFASHITSYKKGGEQ